MKARKVVICATMISVGVFCKTSIAANQFCGPSESVIFFCETEASKNIAICIDDSNDTISYRFGGAGKMEMSYSAKKKDQSTGFFYNHYFRPGIDYLRISFLKNQYKYSVFRNYDAAEANAPSYGVAVSRNGGNEREIKCSSKIIDHMSIIIKYLRCNKSDALGCS